MNRINIFIFYQKLIKEVMIEWANL